MSNMVEKITTEYGEKIVVSRENREKYGVFSTFEGTENALYEFLRDCKGDNLQNVIGKTPSADLIYNFSEQRSNCISWLPIDKSSKVLELGAECGAITSYLVKKAGRVDAIESSLEKCRVNLERNKDSDNLKVYCGDFSRFEEILDKDYDYIFILNNDEVAENREKLAIIIKKLNQHLSTSGKLVYAVNNRLGIKFFAGSRENAAKAYFEGITGFKADGREYAYSKDALVNIFNQAGISEYSVYYPYPDFLFMHTLYSDDRLPKTGELTDNLKNLTGERMSLFDEKSAFDSLIKDGNVALFLNSFLIITGRTSEIIYAKVSNERDKDTALITTIEKQKDSTRIIKKRALFDEGECHIADMAKNYIRLCEKYSKQKIQINKCLGLSEDGASASFEYVEGLTLSEVLDNYLFAGDLDGFNSSLERYMSFLKEKCEEVPYNKDVIFDNILVSGDEWTLIDYEWCDDNPMDYKEIAFRSLHTYLVSDKKRNIFNYDLIFETLGISPKEGEIISAKEFEFQKKVKGNSLSLKDLSDELDFKVIQPIGSRVEDGYRFQVYRGDENGNFTEGDSFFVENAYGPQNTAEVSLDISGTEKMIRLDPLMKPCIVKLHSVSVNGKVVPINKKTVLSNGKFVKPDTFVFSSFDPNLIIRLQGSTSGTVGKLSAEMSIYPMPEDLLANLSAHIGRF